MKKKYIFVLCPPYQGSTIIVNLLNSSKNVSTLLDCKTWAGESQWLYKKHGDKDYEKNRWDPDYKLNMKLVDKVFNIYFNKNKEIWVEKSPPSICRAKMFQDYFSKLGEVYFIISIRNPYSTEPYGADEWIKFAQYQKYNLEHLNNVISISYEECCNDIEKVISKITNKIPELGKIFNNNHQKNNNERGNLIHSNKVDRVIDKEKKNKILKKNIDLVKYFGYNIIE
jgi:hypothetical protein